MLWRAGREMQACIPGTRQPQLTQEGSGIQELELEHWVCPALAVWPRAGRSASLSLSSPRLPAPGPGKRKERTDPAQGLASQEQWPQRHARMAAWERGRSSLGSELTGPWGVGSLREGGRTREGAQLSGVQPLCNSPPNALHCGTRSASQLRDLFVQKLLHDKMGSFHLFKNISY